VSLRTERLYDGAVEHILLNTPKANLLDAAMIAALRTHLTTLPRPGLKLVVLEGAGDHFSFGASVPEHLPGEVGAMLPAFHALFRGLQRLGVMTAAVVRGRCLGGGAELATFCGRVFASPNAKIGVPEVKLAVFPPVAACTLRWRVGGQRATDLICTGRTVDADEALAMGLVDEVSPDPTLAWRGWFEAHLADASAVALSYAWRASRAPLNGSVNAELAAMERLYLDDLMTQSDPIEGLTAFIERRPPAYTHTPTNQDTGNQP